jgi:hypothetical protein
MRPLREALLETIAAFPGKTDRELAELILGRGKPQQSVNQLARQLEAKGRLARRTRHDGLIGNFLPSVEISAVAPDLRTTDPSNSGASADVFSEDSLKVRLQEWLAKDGWSSQIAWGKSRGIDIVAVKGNQQWVIEVKGCGSRQAMRVNYFLAILGETLQRMHSEGIDYFIALPDMPQFVGLWRRLPALAKERTGIKALFVSEDGSVRLAN